MSEISVPPLAKGLKRGVYLVFGFLFFGIGIIGVVLPILPTTPFILLAGVCFLRSSPKFYLWLRTHPRFKDSFEKKGLTNQTKVVILVWAWSILIAGAVFTPILWVKILLISIGVIKTIVFTKFIRTILKEPNSIANFADFDGKFGEIEN
jgi:hypothetical protein